VKISEIWPIWVDLVDMECRGEIFIALPLIRMANVVITESPGGVKAFVYTFWLILRGDLVMF
jgi:hypothetical protein